MIHYHVWFNLKDTVNETEGLAVVSHFLRSLCSSSEAAGFQLLKNNGSSPRSKLPAFHALVEFEDAAQLSEAMRLQAARGVHTGSHGGVIDVVTDFHVEIFTLLGGFSKPTPAMNYACEI